MADRKTHTFSDEGIKKDVTDELYWDGRVNAADVNVEVQDGTVTLTGTVPTYAAREAAYEDAWNVADVTEVTNHIEVLHPATAEVPSDEAIRTDIEETLTRDPEVDFSDLDVSVREGKVTLRGTVEAYWKKFRAEDLTSSLRGVLSIENELAVVPKGAFADRESDVT